LAALEFARALCCQDPPGAGQYCDACSVCRRIARGVFPDVTLFDLSTQAERDREKSRNTTLNVTTVREITSALAYRPSEARWRIAIVDDADSMQETAQEAFLKTLEEPPSYAIVLLLAAETERLLETIRSRCTLVRFGAPSVDAIQQALEASGVSSTDAGSIAVLSDGAMGWAFQASRDPELASHRSTLVTSAVEWVKASSYERMVRALQAADAWSAARDAVRERLEAVLKVWRLLLLQQHQAIQVHGDAILGALPETPVNASPQDMVRAVSSVQEALDDLEANVRPRLVLESMVGAWPTLA
jgi:DNA polymerase-3 subunit delta'